MQLAAQQTMLLNDCNKMLQKPQTVSSSSSVIQISRCDTCPAASSVGTCLSKQPCFDKTIFFKLLTLFKWLCNIPCDRTCPGCVHHTKKKSLKCLKSLDLTLIYVPVLYPQVYRSVCP